MDLPQTDVLETRLENGWLTLTLNDPARRNALSASMAEALLATLDAVRDDRSVRGITLRGSGGVFCSGGDLKGMAGHLLRGDEEAIRAMSAEGGRLFHALREAPQVTLALIEGPAMAGGLGLACCADIVAVTEGATFALTEVRLGIPPAQIAPYVVARLGPVAAKRLMLTAASFGGREAKDLGLADAVEADEAGLDRFDRDIRRKVLACGPEAIAATKALVLRAGERPPEELREEAARVFTERLLSDEGREGIASFTQKRQPAWCLDD